MLDMLTARAKSMLHPRTRERLVRRRLSVRTTTGSLRILPGLLVLGGMRCGTSSLYKYLGEHPGFVPSIRKETEYFTLHHDRDEDWYRSHFPLRARVAMRAARGQRTVGFEATPYYLNHPLVPGRVAAALPDARFVVLLRDPVDRAVSHWMHMARLGFERRSFAEAIAAEEHELADDRRRLQEDPSFTSKPHHRFSYVERGQYADQLERWFAVHPRDRFLVFEADALYDDAQAVCDRIATFVGLDPHPVDTSVNHSYATKGGRGRRVERPDPAPARGLFTDSDRRLPELLGWAPSWV